MPRKFLAEPSLFGKTPYADLAEPDRGLSSQESWQRDTAVVQHRMAFLLRRLAQSRGLTLEQFAAADGTRTSRGERPIRTLRLLRGEAAMQMEDIFWANEVLGERLIVVQFAVQKR